MSVVSIRSRKTEERASLLGDSSYVTREKYLGYLMVGRLKGILQTLAKRDIPEHGKKISTWYLVGDK